MSPLKASEAQLFYANLLNKLTLFGFLVLIISFVIYVSGLVGSYVPLGRLPIIGPNPAITIWKPLRYNLAGAGCTT